MKLWSSKIFVVRRMKKAAHSTYTINCEHKKMRIMERKMEFPFF